MPPDRTGLLIIRVWVEQGSARPLRAQVRLTTNVAAGFASEATLADIDGVVAVVEAWLQDFLLDVEPAVVPPAT